MAKVAVATYGLQKWFGGDFAAREFLDAVAEFVEVGG